MKKDLVTAEIIVKENKVGILRVGNVNYISLTDYITIYIYYELIRHKENFNILGEEYVKSLNAFIRKELMNP